jgi:hypothetical protein
MWQIGETWAEIPVKICNEENDVKRNFLRFLPWALLMVIGMVSAPMPANPQPPRRHARIFEAIRSLEDAREYMRTARTDFCGHRDRAIEETDRAIRQMREAAACER